MLLRHAVGDHDGNALVQWDAGPGQVGFARWNAARQEWSYPAPLALELAFVVDTQRSGHPIVIGNVTNPDSGEPRCPRPAITRWS
jgi:hypothetical protein